MTQIYKSVLLFFLTASVLSLNAQDLAHKIPADASAVASIKGTNLVQLLSINEFNSSFVGKKILGKISKKAGIECKDIQDLGIDLESSIYYYNQSNDSVTYNCLLIPIKSAQNFDKLFSINEKKKMNREGNRRSYVDGDSTEVLMWDEHMLFLAKATSKSDFFDNEDVVKRFGLEMPPVSSYTTAPDTVSTEHYDNETSTTEVDEAKATEDPQVTMDKISKAAKKAHKSKSAKLKGGKHSKTAKKYSKPGKPVIIDEPIEETTEEMDSTETASYANDTVATPSYSDYYTRNTAKQKRIVAGWAQEMAKSMFSNSTSGSVLDNPSYIKSLDVNAEATLWAPNTGKMFSNYFSFPYGTRNMSFLTGYGEFNAKLFLEKDALRISTELTLNEETAASYKKIYNAKLNKKFIKYINEDRMIGCMAYSLNSKAYLEEYPKMLSKVYGLYGDEASIAADLFSLLLDEKAVSNVFKGDGLFILSGLSQKEVTYKTYDYDADYNGKEVEKTKKETMPDFLFMTSTKDTRLLEKLIRYGIKKDKVCEFKEYYQIMLPTDLMDLYLIIKDDIIFLGTNVNEIEKIAVNNYDSKISKEHKNLLLKNSAAFFANPKLLAGKIPVDEYGEFGELGRLNNVFNDMGAIYFKANKMKGSKASTEIVMTVPNNHSNALQYLFSLIEKSRE